MIPGLLIAVVLGQAPPRPLVVAPAAPRAIEAPEACEGCGMDRLRFAHSRMRVTFADARVMGVCSLACAAEAWAKPGASKAVRLEVGAFPPPHALLEAEAAIWVLGGRASGVMTSVPKWAFATPAEARAFVRKQGGRIATFAEARTAAEREP